MPDRPRKIMLLEADPATVEVLAASLTRRFNVDVTCAVDTGSCLDREMFEPHDLAIVDLDTCGGPTGETEGGSTGLGVAQQAGADPHAVITQLLSLGSRPIILMASRPTYDDLVTAMRAGVRDVFRKPFPVEQLLDAVGNALRQTELAKRQARKYRRMRDLVRDVIRDRRELNRRVELICRDLVQAQRDLLARVVRFQQRRSGKSPA